MRVQSRFVPTKKNKRRYEIDNRIKAMLRELIREKEMAMANGEAIGDDLLSLMLQCKGQSDSEMTIDDVIEECKLFYFAGQETTANWLTWTMIVLSMHTDWQDKARQEVQQICGENVPHLQTINRLKIVRENFQYTLPSNFLRICPFNLVPNPCRFQWFYKKSLDYTHR